MAPGVKLVKSANPESALSELRQLAEMIYQHADGQRWDELPHLLASFDQLLRAQHFTAVHAKNLQNIQSTVNAATELARQRRDEIGRLVNALGGPA